MNETELRKLITNIERLVSASREAKWHLESWVAAMGDDATTRDEAVLHKLKSALEKFENWDN